jgi:hypothetical protein
MSIPAELFDASGSESADAGSPPMAHRLSGRGFDVVRIVLGVLLLTVAGLKLYGLNVTAIPRAGWFATPQVQVVAAEWELVLGLWLLSGAYPAGAWLATVGTFLAFAGVSGFYGWVGVANCGCFGVIRTSPWTAFAVDVAALGLLAFARPRFPTGPGRPAAGAVAIPVGAAVVLTALTGVGAWLYGSPQAALARLRGEVLTASPDYVDFGVGTASHMLERTVEVRNWSERPVRLVGGTSDCSCVVTADLPLTIPPGEGRVVTVRATIPATNPGAVTRLAELWTDCPEWRKVRLRVGWRVVE